MANIKSQKKRNITNEKARLRNRAIRSELKTATRRVTDAVQAENGGEAYAAALKASRLMDRAVTKGVIHKHQAANRKSGIMKLANTVATAEDIAAYKPAEKKAPQATGSKKAAVKAERLKAMEAASKEKAKNREKTVKAQAGAAKKKADAEAKAEKEAAKAAAAEAAKPEEAPTPAEEATEESPAE
ncbi:MAG: 30S ribosomal protein S20 [Eggerthellaceae bacterium]|nr:30S ribosomal protein S20 [Eggerthellaceae bacterium]